MTDHSTSASSHITRRVLLIRHGQTEWSLTDRHTGRTDIDLTARGEQDARALAGITDRLGLTDPYVFASPRTRARRTAELAGLTVDEVDDRFAEWDYGDYEGLTRAQIHADGDPEWTIWTAGGPRGESVQDMTRRVDGAVDLVEQRLTDGDVVVVSHGHFSRSFVCRFLGWPIGQGSAIDLRPAGAAMLMQLGSDRRLCTLVGPEGAAATHAAL
ncbi:histidine phosphatase family protein [Gordonia aquimaris]|uniref:Histidine phosphatase family protein n=1 Tax=Gordonia aquimaris TaxID=2984863 RepID=A0A9X3D2F2_9ACTN|nr:histidine phosphatase family protein [Gordonia aquimaris]MCX2962566.1 histidine phosphatase family protein [Gordonia aquimaris]